jgi:hypothetical protein
MTSVSNAQLFEKDEFYIKNKELNHALQLTNISIFIRRIFSKIASARRSSALLGNIISRVKQRILPFFVDSKFFALRNYFHNVVIVFRLKTFNLK